MRSHLGLGDAKEEDIFEDTVKAVAETLKTSSFLKISEDGKKVGRTTIVASPLEYNVKREDVESNFSQFAFAKEIYTIKWSPTGPGTNNLNQQLLLAWYTTSYWMGTSWWRPVYPVLLNAICALKRKGLLEHKRNARSVLFENNTTVGKKRITINLTCSKQIRLS